MIFIFLKLISEQKINVYEERNVYLKPLSIEDDVTLVHDSNKSWGDLEVLFKIKNKPFIYLTVVRFCTKMVRIVNIV